MKRCPEDVPLRMERPLNMVRHGYLLAATNRFSEQRIAALPVNTEFEITIRRRRSNRHNGKYWALLHEVVKASEKYATAEHLHRALLLALGYTDNLITLDGRVLVIPDSTAFGKMDQAKFEEYYTKAVALLATLLGDDPMTLLKAADAA